MISDNSLIAQVDYLLILSKAMVFTGHNVYSQAITLANVTVIDSRVHGVCPMQVMMRMMMVVGNVSKFKRC